ncbi:MAG: AraC family transcriptional regulator [Sporolactobacillus sp.]|nr:AraC family transcriptional regulator [Sporolactobacillus sp.]
MISYKYPETFASVSKELEIESLITIYYFEFSKDYVFNGEKHDFWELVYVDGGKLEVSADQKCYMLKEGDVIFHKPNEFHKLWANGECAPNVLVVTFNCHSRAMAFFENKIISLKNDEKVLLANLLKEAKNAFKSPLGKLYERGSKLENPVFASEQLVATYLTLFLITIIRRKSKKINQKRTSFSTRLKLKRDITTDIIMFMKKRLNTSLTLDEICSTFFFSKSYLKEIFKRETGSTVIEYFNDLKMKEAKKLIRESTLNFTAISHRLGFDSVHYFSTSFKKHVGLSPSQYAHSIQVIEQRMSRNA